jgi:hypothetical protein
LGLSCVFWLELLLDLEPDQQQQGILLQMSAGNLAHLPLGALDITVSLRRLSRLWSIDNEPRRIASQAAAI